MNSSSVADPAEEGSAEYPFEISTVEDLALLSQHPDATFVLVNDIDCAGVAFSMLEMPGEGFSGTWNGNGHVIRNLSIQGTNAALMDKIAPEGHIYDLRIETPSVTADDTASVLALQCKGTLERVFVLGGQVAGVNASGLVGTADGSAVLSCAASAQVRGTQSAGALFLSVSGTCRLESVFALSEGLPAASDASASDIPVLDLSPETVSGSQADTVTVLGDFPAELLARIAFSSSDETVFTVGSDGSLILTGAGTANLTVSLSVGTDVYRYTKSITVEISEDLPADSTAPEEETSDEPDAPVSPLSLTGWQEIDGSRYYYDANGVPVTGWQMIDGRRYYFAEDGKQQTGFWCYAGAYWYYYDENGQLLYPGWNIVSGYMRYVSDGGSFLTGKQVIEGTTYYFGSSGILQTNTVVEDGGKRYFVDGNGAVQYGWQTAGGFRYYSDEANGIYTGWQMIDGRRYYFAEDGKQQTGFWCYAGQYWYYYDESGQLPAPGWNVISGYMRYVSDGGSFLTGKQVINGTTYYFGSSGILQTNTVVEDGGKRYFVDGNGAVQYGWQTAGGFRYYSDEANGIYTGWQMIDGRRYYFAEDGKQQIGFWCYAGAYWYYYDENGQLPAPGWQVISGYMRYVSSGGSFLTGKQVIDGITYYFGDSGILQTDTFVEGNGKRYYVNSAGIIQTGWFIVNGARYYSDDANGIYTGWQMINGRRYCFDSEGRQQLGFQCYAGQYWYYYDENGQLPAPGWQVISGYMRYVSSGGSFVTGVQLIDGKYYLFGESGIQQKGWAEVYGQLYHSDANGYVTFGWYDENGNRYYFDPSTGAAYRNGIFTIENIRYQFDANGVCLGRVVDSTEGIDVSAHQGSVDWEAVAESGIKYAIIRAVTWSNSEGYYIIDPYFEQNVRNAKSNGLLVGAYLYSYAFSESEISEEVFFFHNSAEMQRLRKDGIVLDLPVFIDYEDPLILQNTSSNSQRTNIVRYGMTLLDQLGYSTGFYTYDYFARNYMDAQALINEGYDFWVANFNGTNSFEGQAEIWQYTSTGSVPGVTGNVDRNRFYKTYTSGGGSIPTPTPNQFTVTDQNTNSIVTDSVTNILAKIVQNEVGGGLGLTGADKLKLYTAQAVAANSWLQYQYAHGITAPEVGLKTVTDSSIYTAVEEAQKYVVTYNGEAACTVYGSASGTMTNSSERMGWGALPYLVSVKSKYESSFGSKYQGYTIQNKISTATMKNSIEKMLGAGATNGYPTSQWLQNPVFDSNGYCISIQVCGKTVNGGKFYENCYNLLSPKFEIIENGENGVWVFKTWGNGHCVGMSQYGAAGYIQTGMSWQDVLLHYYPGTTISNK